jgi:hypothetical protein
LDRLRRSGSYHPNVFIRLLHQLNKRDES